ncbi:MAG: HEAT repeat domain-containing protein [Gemmataceae bacterium]|nr:HEAT repeat domain-containing protein [Gemmataceae bacterium]
MGRLRASRAVDPLVALVAEDTSPDVRAAAAQALALIGSGSKRATSALPALRGAAEKDLDPKVRHTAQFAAEIIQLADR